MKPPQRTSAIHATIRVPRIGPTPADGWVADTYRLIDAFECERRKALGTEAQPSASFVIAASDYLWERFHAEAHWERFELDGLFRLFAPFVRVEGWADECIAALTAFFAFLQRTHVIDAHNGLRIQAELGSRRAADKEKPRLFRDGVRS